MHWRWAVTFRPLARKSSESSSGVLTTPYLINNEYRSTIVVEEPAIHHRSGGRAASRRDRCDQHPPGRVQATRGVLVGQDTLFAGHQALAGTPAHGLGIVGRLAGSGCIVTEVGCG